MIWVNVINLWPNLKEGMTNYLGSHLKYYLKNRIKSPTMYHLHCTYRRFSLFSYRRRGPTGMVFTRPYLQTWGPSRVTLEIESDSAEERTEVTYTAHWLFQLRRLGSPLECDKLSQRRGSDEYVKKDQMRFEEEMFHCLYPIPTEWKKIVVILST